LEQSQRRWLFAGDAARQALSLTCDLSFEKTFHPQDL
jgi:hypothetical protein